MVCFPMGFPPSWLLQVTLCPDNEDYWESAGAEGLPGWGGRSITSAQARPTSGVVATRGGQTSSARSAGGLQAVEMRREVGEGVTEAGLNRPTSSARSRPEDRARRSRAGSGGFGSNEELARNTLDKWEQEQPQQIEEQEVKESCPHHAPIIYPACSHAGTDPLSAGV